MTMDDDYRREKEAFVSDTSGSSIGHINAISLAALSSLALYHALHTRIHDARWVDNFIAQVFLLVAPLLLSMTFFANAPWILNGMLLVPALVLLLRPAYDDGASPLPIQTSNKEDEKKRRAPASSVQPIAALSTWRGHMMLMTALCILAVDFTIYPRELAKCETFGTGLMDIGVGSFVFAQGLTSASPLLRNPQSINAPLIPKLASASRKVFPLFILAAARVIAVKGTAYPEHVSEYGAHWNFFLTLALLPPLQVMLHPLLSFMSPTVLGLIVTIAHQTFLSYTSFQDWALNAPRISLVTANREGLSSLPGYFAIHLLGLGLGVLVLAPSPSYFRRAVSGKDGAEMIRPRDNGRLAMELGGWTVLWWTMLGLSLAFGPAGGVTRRLANMPYVFWTAAFNVSFLVGFIVLDQLFAPPAPKKRLHKPVSSSTTTSGAIMTLPRDTVANEAPPLLEAINKNGLVLFLIANLGTGAVNLSMKTLHASDSTAMFVLSAYASTFCAIAWTYRHRRLWKF